MGTTVIHLTTSESFQQIAQIDHFKNLWPTIKASL